MNQIKKLAKQIFQYEAKLILKKYKPKIIAITGSVGKTLTKEAIYLALSKKFFIRKSEKSFTTGLGIPLAIIGCSQGTGSLWQWMKNLFLGLRLILVKVSYPEYLILEMDADRPGDLALTKRWLKPDILVITAIGEIPSHIESFGTLEEFLREKKDIVDSIKNSGVIIYNTDDPVTQKLSGGREVRKVSCGISERAELKGSEFEIIYAKSGKSLVPTGMSFEIENKSSKYRVSILESLGVQNEYASLLAFGVATELGLNPKEIEASLNKFISLRARMKIVQGVKDTLIIDDTYNASPIAMQEAIKTFGKIKTSGREIAVVGDMLELGKFSAESHKNLAPILKENVDFVLSVGFRARRVVEELLDLGFSKSSVISVDTVSEASTQLKEMLKEGDLILVKGSQAMRMEKIVEEIMRHPEDKGKLLIRQEREWLIR